MLPYGRQTVDEADVAAVVETLRSDWLTTGPRVGEFEEALAAEAGAAHAVAVSSGTAALHTMIAALGVGPGDEVIVPVLTFAASANCVLYCGAKPVFVDVDPSRLLIDPAAVAHALTPRTKAIIAVDYAGHPCDYAVLEEVASESGAVVLADACHALGASYEGRPVGSLAHMSVFSFHPVKHITTAEGGAVTTEDAAIAQRMRVFRNHGITSDHARRASEGNWTYEIEDLGYNYRISDVQCALGVSQLRKLKSGVARRQEIAQRYAAALAELEGVSPLERSPDVSHAYHLYVVQLDTSLLRVGRAEVFAALRAENIGVNVHYIPVPWHPYYQRQGYRKGAWPVAEAAYERILSLPMWPGMTDQDVDDTIEALRKVVEAYRR